MSASGIREGIYSNATVRRIAQWLNAVPHPQAVWQIAPEYVAAARWDRGGKGLEGFAVEPLSAGALEPTAVETNLLNASEVLRRGGKSSGRISTSKVRTSLSSFPIR